MYTREEIAPGVHLLSTFNRHINLAFNQYILVDEHPTLISSGTVQMVDGMRQRIDEVGDVAALRYIVVPHFESDECGAVTSWQEQAPAAEPIVGAVCARQLIGFGLTKKLKQVKNDDVVELGRMRLRFISVGSEMHLWDGIIAFEETHGILFSSDFFGQRGDAPQGGDELKANLIDMFKMSLPSASKTEAFITKMRKLDIRMIAPGHGFPIRDGISSHIDAIEAACVG